MAAQPIVWLTQPLRVIELDKQDAEVYNVLRTDCCAMQYDAYKNKTLAKRCQYLTYVW